MFTGATTVTYVTSWVRNRSSFLALFQDCELSRLSLISVTMPGIKQRTTRRKKRKPPVKRPVTPDIASSKPDVASTTTATTTSLTSLSPVTTVSGSTSTTTATPSISTSSATPTASEKKLMQSISDLLDKQSSTSESESDEVYEGRGVRLLELQGLQSALQSLLCRECHGGPVIFKEDFTKKEGLCTKPFLLCENCGNTTAIDFSTTSGSKVLAINQKAVFANKCAGGSSSSLNMFCAMLDAPLPISKNIYSQYNKDICEKSITQVQESMMKAREEIREHYEATSEEDVVDILVSCDGTWQKRGFSSLYGAVFVIAYETGKVIDYMMMSKYFAGCNHWEKHDKLSDGYKEWKMHHKCDANFSGSSGAMEPQGAVTLFKRSLDYNMIHASNFGWRQQNNVTFTSRDVLWSRP